MAVKALEQQISHSEVEKKENEWREKHDRMQSLYDELVQHVGDLATENEELRANCQELEEGNGTRPEILATMEDVQAENKLLQQSMEEAMQLVEGMRSKMADFGQAHDILQKKLIELKAEKDEAYQTCEVLQREIDLLRRMGQDESTYHSSEDEMDVLEALPTIGEDSGEDYSSLESK